jgi:soluble lytic murein transglycosylase-like protein
MKNETKILLLLGALFGLTQTSYGKKIVSEVKDMLGITKPLPISEIDPAVYNKIVYYADSYNIPLESALAVAMIESSFQPDNKNPFDPSYGLFAITPALAFDYGYIYDYKNPSDDDINALYDIDNNCEIAMKYLKYLFSHYPEEVAVQMYNVGEQGYLKLGYRNVSYLNKYLAYKEFYQKELGK